MPCAEECTPTDVAQILISQGMLEDILEDMELSPEDIAVLLKGITPDAIEALTKSPEEAARVQAYIDRKLTEGRSGILYDSTARDILSHKGTTVLDKDHPFADHTTQRYPDGYRVSWDNPDQTNFHWTNKNIPTSDQETRHKPPPDAHRDNDPKE